MEQNPDIILVWPKGRVVPQVSGPSGYATRPLRASEDDAWVAIHRCAIPSFAEADLRVWLARYRELALADGILIARHVGSGLPVATAGSLANSKGEMFPRGGQLGWVATVPAHRRRGLASWLCALATKRLVDEGFDNVFLCTGDDMVPAIRTYLRLGYIPCPYGPDQRQRWQSICQEAGLPFEPHEWPSCEEYVGTTADG